MTSTAVVWLAAVTVIALGALAVAYALAAAVARAERRADLALQVADDALDAADRAVDAVNQVIDHLTGREPPAGGRHAHT